MGAGYSRWEDFDWKIVDSRMKFAVEVASKLSGRVGCLVQTETGQKFPTPLLLQTTKVWVDSLHVSLLKILSIANHFV